MVFEEEILSDSDISQHFPEEEEEEEEAQEWLAGRGGGGEGSSTGAPRGRGGSWPYSWFCREVRMYQAWANVWQVVTDGCLFCLGWCR